MDLTKLYQPCLILIIGIVLCTLIHRKYSTNIRQSILDKTDKKIILLLSLIYTVISFSYFGQINHYGSWVADTPNKSFSITFKQPTDVDKVYYYYGVGNGNLQLTYIDQNNQNSNIVFNNNWAIYKWQSISITSSKAIKQLIISPQTPGIELKQLAIFNHQHQLVTNYILNTSNNDLSAIKTLFSNTAPHNFDNSLLSSTYFDEVYYARTAYEYLHGLSPYTSVHPPLGMLLIAIGIIIFGMNSFGWRLIPNLAGIALIGIMYLFAKRLFGSRRGAIIASILLMFDFMHFSLNRMASIDSTATLFIVLEYYFLYSYLIFKHKEQHNQSIIALFWCGIFFGLGMATKWDTIFTVPLIFGTILYTELWKKRIFPIQLIKTITLAIILLIIIPLTIYLSSYIPGFIANTNSNFSQYVLVFQETMFNYHMNIAKTITHTYSSNWWSWPLIVRPLSLFYWQDNQGLSSSVVLLGNPAIWWLGLVTISSTLLIAVKTKKLLPWYLCLMAFSLYLPWIFVGRLSFIYYFYVVTPFWILTIAYILQQSKPIIIYSYLVLVILLFIMFYPALSGIPVSRNYVVHYLQWFSSWNF